VEEGPVMPPDFWEEKDCICGLRPGMCCDDCGTDYDCTVHLDCPDDCVLKEDRE
jgi:hypothetical protein